MKTTFKTFQSVGNALGISTKASAQDGAAVQTNSRPRHHILQQHLQPGKISIEEALQVLEVEA